MALRTAQVTITREGRDKGGVFQLQEMPAERAAEWLIRAGQLLVRAGVDIPGDITDHGITGFVALGVGTIISGFGKASWSETKPLLDELKDCVISYRPPSGTVDLPGWRTITTQIQEVSTHIQLYEEALSLMVGFSIADALSTAYGRVAAIVATGLGLATGTSPANSESSSPPAMPG